MLGEERQAKYAAELLQALHEERRLSGLPHWITVDEAQVPFSDENAACSMFQSQTGLCLVTYDPAQLCRSSGLDFDFLIAVPGENGMHPAALEGMLDRWHIDPLAQLPAPPEGQAFHWLAHAIHDETLASTARDLEGQSQADGAFEGLRHALAEAIEIRYLA